jgi:HD-GYP domain-containing protein (c-di-GMP phosphodiesterase class II)/HAMP domain-containing protein
MPPIESGAGGEEIRGRVARRIFLVFLVCSLMPVSVFALFSYRQVRIQLERDAAANLRSASKIAGMTILERVLIAEHALSLLANRGDLTSRDGRLAIEDGRIIEIVALEAAPLDAELGEAERAMLAAGGTLLRVRPGSAPPARIELLRRADPERADSPVLAAWLDPSFVFEPRRRSEQDGYRVEDQLGQVLFADGPREEAMAERGAELDASWELFLRARFQAAPWTVTFTRPIREIHRPLQEFETIFPLVALATLSAAIALSLSQIRRSLIPIEKLAAAARRISTGELDVRVAIDSRDEFGELARAFNEMTEELSRQNGVLSAINEIGAALSAEQDTARLLDLILRGSARVTGAIGGALFLSPDGGPLELARVWLDPGSTASPAAPDVALDPVVVRRCRERRTPIVSNDFAGLDSVAEVRAWTAFEAALGVPIGPRLAVPLLNGAEQALGVLVLFRKAPGDARFSAASCRHGESLASQATIAIAKNRLADGFRSLFEGVTRMTVQAIDGTSPDTGDRSRKLPILTELIADAACAATIGPLKGFDLSEAERYELRVAAMLHDWGKVVDERRILEHHAVPAIYLLGELPFPRSLAAVPEIAGSHHELDGSGDPGGLRQGVIAMQGRILGLADAFETLTARNRPHQSVRTLSEALEILAAMRGAGSVDADLHDLFVTQNVYLRYAAEHLAPEQIDAAHWEDLERLTAGQ